MTALEEMKAALQEAKMEAATLRIRVRELEAKLVEVAAASDPVLRQSEAVGTCRVYRHGAGEQPKLPHLKQENCVDWNPAGGPEQDRGAADIRPAPHAFLPTPFYPSRCDAKVDEDGRIRTCGRPQGEHPSVRTSAKE